MATKYRVVHWRFDTEAFSRHITAWVVVVGAEAIADAVGVDHSTVENWSYDCRGSKGRNYPNMTNFIKVCDELSLDPRDFWTTTE